MTRSKSGAKVERIARLRDAAGGSGAGKMTTSPDRHLQLQCEDSDATVTRITRALRAVRPDLGEDEGAGASASYLAASFLGYAAEKCPKTEKQWCELLAEVLSDAGDELDDEDNDAAVTRVIQELVRKGVLAQPAIQFEAGDAVFALLEEDEDWHEAVVKEILGNSLIRVFFLEYGKPQDTLLSDVRLMDLVMDDEDTEMALREGDCEMCQRHMMLTFHHLIPKDTHPTYLKKRLPRGIEGEPTRGFLNSYGTMICKQCHGYIHRLASNEVLAREYNTLPKILEHPHVQRWVAWAATQRAPGKRRG